jgi:hypothetical protein
MREHLFERIRSNHIELEGAPRGRRQHPRELAVKDQRNGHAWIAGGVVRRATGMAR